MFWEKGRKQVRRKNARVVIYVRQGLDIRVEKKMMEENVVLAEHGRIRPKEVPGRSCLS